MSPGFARQGKAVAVRMQQSVSVAAKCVAVLALLAAQSRAETTAGDAGILRVAVASSFSQTAGRLCRAFFSGRPGRCVLTPGASGLLASQVAQGAPFDVLLSADRRRAERLEAEGLAVPGSRFTYAIGRLVLWAPDHRGGEDLKAVLSGGTVRTLAIANPGSAPYGAAAMETLRALGVDASRQLRIVKGENAAQAFQFVASGAADAGFIALSQVTDYEATSGTSITDETFPVDPSLHAPIEQQAIQVEVPSPKPVASEWLEFLRSDTARRIIVAAGYALPPL
jgi:molybdate transport system substrate-binding protein